MSNDYGPGWKRWRAIVRRWLMAAAMAGACAQAAGPADPEARLLWLRQEVARHDELYFKRAAPEIGDAEYDRLKRELRELEAANPERAPADAPAGIGDDRDGRFPVWRHRVPMLGLDKAYTEAELRACVARATARLGDGTTLVVEPKYDGLAISAVYEHGKLQRLVTRGDGRAGDEVTANRRILRGLPDTLAASTPGDPVPDLVELRGEVYVSLAEFKRINAEREQAGEAPFSHPRNLAAGTLKSTDPEALAARRLDVVFYGWGAWEGEPPPATQREFHAWVRRQGLPGVSEARTGTGADEIWSLVQACGRARAAWPFPTDGVVVKVDAVDGQRQLGHGPTAPNWAIACKFRPLEAVTRVRGITWQVGRTGVLTPVAELEPVRLAGSTITRATLHNRDEIARRDIRIGDYVRVEKAGEIVPAIVGVELDRRPSEAAPYVFPERCPSCATVLIDEKGQAAVRCPNRDCPAQVCRRVEYFAAAIGVKGLGPAAVQALVESGRVKSAADLFRLRRTDPAGLPGLGDKTAARLLAEIERGRRAELWRIVNGLGIPQVGPANARRLADGIGTLANLAKAERYPTSLGPAVRTSLREYFAEPANRALVEDLVALGAGQGERTGAGLK